LKFINARDVIALIKQMANENPNRGAIDEIVTALFLFPNNSLMLTEVVLKVVNG
jgi:hypothetical protein